MKFTLLRHSLSFALLTALCCAISSTSAAPLPTLAVPEPLKTWLPWVMHGHETFACPPAHNDGASRVCLWPTRLELQAGKDGATFRYDVQVFGAPAWLALPGELSRWPQDVKLGGTALAVVEHAGRPAVQLGAGSHSLTGTLRWAEVPADVLLPKEAGSLQITLNGKAISRTPDADGRVALQAVAASTQASDALTVRVSRLVEDDIPLHVTTHFDLAVSGQPREIQLPAALLPGFVAESLDSPLPTRLHEAGSLRVQARPGNWTVEIRGRLMSPVNALALPADTDKAASEIWSFAAHNELRLVTAEGLTSVDAKQVPIPEAWRAYPAYQIKPGQVLKLTESRRGNPQPGADKLSLQRQIWLDFDGGGYTLQDTLSGELLRSWRLEMAAPGVLGRAAADGNAQPVTRLAGSAADGIELRQGKLNLSADSRIEGSHRTLPATGWQADFNSAQAQLNLPPGWRLLHAGGVDQAGGSWVARWTLWDFFFVLLSVLAAGKLLGWRTAVVVAAGLVLTWHMPDAPQHLWLALVGLLALTRVLPAGKLLHSATWASRLCVGAMALVLIPYAVDQIRLSIHPSLERPGVMVGDGAASQNLSMAPAAAPMVVDMVAGELKEDASAVSRMASRSVSKSKAPTSYASARVDDKALDEIDPNAKVQTGPGLPAWRWNSHQLTWQGPVQSAQSLSLVLLPPAGTVALRLGGLGLIVAALWLLARGLPRWANQAAGGVTNSQGAPSAVTNALLSCVCAALLAALLGGTVSAWAASPPPSPSPSPSPEKSSPVTVLPGNIDLQTPSNARLDELRTKLTAPADCQPQCASIARLRVQAQGASVQLRLEVHAQADTMLPLPGQGANWRPTLITSDGKPATTRRDAGGALWLAVRAGVSQVLLSADVGDASSVEMALPLPVREVTADAPGWTVSGLDARGMASGALSLSRQNAAAGITTADTGTQRDALPPFVRIERVLHLGLRWSVETRISRLTPSRAPLQVKIKLLDGEAVTNEVVRISEGHALVQLGNEDTASFVSSLKESPKLQLVSTREPHQIEQWQLDASTQWHVGWSGIAPIQYVDAAQGRFMPSWQPWPGESAQLQIGKPAGTAGQTLTLDRLTLALSPGLRATDVSSSANLRSSQGSNHRVKLPPNVEFLGAQLDNQALAIQPQSGELLIPITPGAHSLNIHWREPRGMGWWFESTPHSLGVAGVNASTQINLPPDRVLLATGGPRIGPAVLLWGVLIVLIGVAVALSKSRVTPLGGVAWFLLGLGLAQTSLISAAVVASWFFALAARKRWAAQSASTRWVINAVQVLLILWTLSAAAALLNAIQVGLLGYPDMMVVGNGSTAQLLNWYQDRFSATTPIDTTWVITTPVLVYRLLMLLWALWLAASVLRWVKWAWECFSAGGYWFKSATKEN
jgi:hypothetical protein